MFTDGDIQLISQEADNFLELMKHIEAERELPTTDAEVALLNVEVMESVQDFRSAVANVFKNFPEPLIVSPLEELKDRSFSGSLNDKMGMVYYYLLNMIEYFSLNGDVLKTDLANNRDVIILAMKLEEKLLVSFKESVLQIIFLLLDDKTDATEKFLESKNMTLSAASTLLLIGYKGNDKVKQAAIGKTLILADYIASMKNEQVPELFNLFSKLIEQKGDAFIKQMASIFTGNVIQQPKDVVKFLEKVLLVEDTRSNIASSLFIFTRKLIAEGVNK